METEGSVLIIGKGEVASHLAQVVRHHNAQKRLLFLPGSEETKQMGISIDFANPTGNYLHEHTLIESVCKNMQVRAIIIAPEYHNADTFRNHLTGNKTLPEIKIIGPKELTPKDMSILWYQQKIREI